MDEMENLRDWVISSARDSVLAGVVTSDLKQAIVALDREIAKKAAANGFVLPPQSVVTRTS